MMVHLDLCPDRLYSPEEQKELVRRYQEEGDEKAGDLLVQTNMPWVISFVSDLKEDPDRRDDLIQAGAEGLCKAREKYDLDKGVNFLSYAQYWIRAYTTQTNWNFHTIKRERGDVERKISNNLGKARRKLEDRGEKTSPKNLAKEMDVPLKNLREYLKVDGLVSLNKPVFEQDSGKELGDFIEAENNHHPADVYDTKRLIALLKEVDLFDDKRTVDDLTNDMKRFFSSRWHDAEHTLRLLSEYSDRLTERAADVWNNRIMCPRNPTILDDLGEKWDVSSEAIRLHEKRLKKQFQKELLRRHGIKIDWV